jgi:hypothetical protein
MLMQNNFLKKFVFSILTLFLISFISVSTNAYNNRFAEGFVDAIHTDCGVVNGRSYKTLKVGGWAWYPDNRSQNTPLKVLLNGREVAITVANMPRNGLPGNYAFQTEITLDANTSGCNTQRQDVDVYVNDSSRVGLNKQGAIVTTASSGATPPASSNSNYNDGLDCNIKNTKNCFQVSRYDYINGNYVLNNDGWKYTNCSGILSSYYQNCQKARQQNIGDLFALQVNYMNTNNPNDQFYQYLYYNSCENNNCYGPSSISPKTWYSYDKNGNLKTCDQNGCILDWYQI